MATRSRTNQKDKGFKAFPPVMNLTKGEKDNQCYGRFNSIENREIIHKTRKQIEFMDNCFYNNEPKITLTQTVETMQKTMDPDGNGLLFCWCKQGTYMPKNGVHKAAYEAWQGSVWSVVVSPVSTMEMCFQKTLQTAEVPGSTHCKASRKRSKTRSLGGKIGRNATRGMSLLPVEHHRVSFPTRVIDLVYIREELF